MKKWSLLLLLCFGLLGQDRQSNNKPYGLRIIGRTVELGVEEDGSSIFLRKVVPGPKVLTISTDEMKYNADTSEIEPRGNVRVKLN